jgi:hypothetical protein
MLGRVYTIENDTSGSVIARRIVNLLRPVTTRFLGRSKRISVAHQASLTLILVDLPNGGRSTRIMFASSVILTAVPGRAAF